MNNLMLISLLIISTFCFGNLEAKTLFPVKKEMRARVNFWKKVYTEISTQEAFVHDPKNLSIVYKKVKLAKSRRGRIQQGKRVKRALRKIIRSIAKKGYSNLSKKEKRVAKIIGKRNKRRLYRMANDIRFQYGLKDRYYQGLIRSYKYLTHIKKTFKSLRLPPELIYLPHVESSFNYHAYSKVGAAGIWQFMRSTARMYGLKVGYTVDDRRDPLKATRAAARLLKDNYRILKSWPLALTAYNHGARTVARAVRKLGTKDINTIVENYKGRRFGFASKNFYATFMATVEISKNPGKYFRSFKKPSPLLFSSLKLKRRYTIKQLTKYLGLSQKIIKKYNPSIRRNTYRSFLYLPKGFTLQLPKTKKARIANYGKKLSSIKQVKKEFALNRMHIISRGENLYDISKMYRVKMRDIINYNRIARPSRIYAGMKLKIPGKKEIRKLKRIKVTKVAKKSILKKTPVLSRSIIDGLVNLESYKLNLQNVSRDVYKIYIEPEETLGHFAEWAKIPTQRIRNLNRLRKGRSIHLGQKIKIQLSRTQLNSFKRNRNEYHVSIQEDFYNSYKIAGKDYYTVKSGDTISDILKRVGLPYWLVRKYQPRFKLSHNIARGQKIPIPKIESSLEESTLLPSN